MHRGRETFAPDGKPGHDIHLTRFRREVWKNSLAWNFCAWWRTARLPRRARWDLATATKRTKWPWKRCARPWMRWRWTAPSSSAKGNATKLPCFTSAKRLASPRMRRKRFSRKWTSPSIHLRAPTFAPREPPARSPCWPPAKRADCCTRSEEHTSELQSQFHLVCRLLLEKKKKNEIHPYATEKTKKS